MRRYRDYDPFAWLYTHYWGDEFHRQIMPVLDRLLLSGLPRRARILDLCCGDGRVSYQLAKRGFIVTGVDGSEQMLTFAKQRAPKIEFLLKDARSFQLPLQYQGAVSTFDSLNHVMEADGLEQVFRNVNASLQEGAVFVFDLNREEAYIDFWARTSTSVDPKAVSIARGSYDGHEKIAHCDVTLFRLERGDWQRSDFRLSQRYYPMEIVLEMLRRTGFQAVIFDGADDLKMRGDVGAGRSFFAARKISCAGRSNAPS
jgi:SAM-dependent methyltransferase